MTDTTLKVLYSSPNPCQLGPDAISNFAEELAENFKYEVGGNLKQLVESLGGKISYQDLFGLEESISGSIQVDGEKDFHIFLAKHTSEARDRFTTCHELGHYFLHYLYPNSTGLKIQKLQAARYGTGSCEYEANWFAAAFLMPTQKFKVAYSELKGSIDLLASRFGVSTQSASIRVDVLKLNER